MAKLLHQGSDIGTNETWFCTLSGIDDPADFGTSLEPGGSGMGA
jgi:hypothetical protein